MCRLKDSHYVMARGGGKRRRRGKMARRSGGCVAGSKMLIANV